MFFHQPSMQIIEENCCCSNWNIVTEFRMGIILHSLLFYILHFILHVLLCKVLHLMRMISRLGIGFYCRFNQDRKKESLCNALARVFIYTQFAAADCTSTNGRICPVLTFSFPDLAQ